MLTDDKKHMTYNYVFSINPKLWFYNIVIEQDNLFREDCLNLIRQWKSVKPKSIKKYFETYFKIQ